MITTVCDNCGVKETTSDNLTTGISTASSYFSFCFPPITKTRNPTCWQFCSLQCASKWLAESVKIAQSNPSVIVRVTRKAASHAAPRKKGRRPRPSR